jgi:uncharacterized membrane protein (UPF0127 family)
MSYNRKAAVRTVRACAALLLAGVCASCAESQSPQGHLETRELAVETPSARFELTVELARRPSEKEAGLMFRKVLAAGEGMLFVYDRDQVMTFWMKNTSLPLSIAFIAHDGRITEIRGMEPFSLRHVRSKRSVRYALEVPLGWFDAAGITVGDRLIIESPITEAGSAGGQ